MKSLKFNIFLYFVLFATIPLLIAATVILYNMNREKCTSIHSKHREVLKIVEQDITAFIHNIEHIGAYVKDKYPVKKAMLLRGLIRVEKNLSSLYILDKQGILLDFSSKKKTTIFKGYDFSNTPYVKAIINGATNYWSDVYLEYASNRPSIAYAVRIDQERIAVLHIDLKVLHTFANKFKGIDNKESIVRIIDSKGQFIAHPPRIEFVQQRQSILSSRLYKEFIAKGLAYKQIRFDGIEKRNKIGIYGKIKKHAWIVIVTEDYDTLFDGYHKLLGFMIAFIVVLLLVSLYIAIKMSHSILNPLRKLSSAMSHITDKQHYSSRLNTNFFELDSLVQSFTRMQDTIEHQTLLLTNKNKELEASNQELQSISQTDFLTGIANRRHFMDIAKQYLEIAKRNNTPCQLMMLDIDHFKQVNDSYGHEIGDKVLILFTQTISKLLRKSDLFGRIGGEEFAIILQNTTHTGAIAFAKRILSQIRTLVYKDEHYSISFTVSIGLSSFENSKNLETLLSLADKALYQSKESGRDCFSTSY